MKFGTQMHSGNVSKTAKRNLEKGRGLGHLTPIFLAYTLSYLQRDKDLKFGTQMQGGNASKTAKKNLEKGLGIGHVTHRIFGIP